ncbi:MAG: hypothetical protein ACRDL5_17135, partial [Solirubrobacteraceae bacterium]
MNGSSQRTEYSSVARRYLSLGLLLAIFAAPSLLVAAGLAAGALAIFSAPAIARVGAERRRA